MKKGLKIFLKTLLILLLVVVLVVGGYVAYVFITYDRLDDNLTLTVEHNEAANPDAVPVSKGLSLISFNIGFAAYTPEFGFFMDGGTESRAFSKDAVIKDMSDIISCLSAEDADFYLLEEVDEDATRTYHVNEVETVTDAFGSYSSIYAQNWDSAYLFYPVTCPTGAAKTGLVTLSRYAVTSSLRRQLPKETGVMKIVDYDRCYSVSRIPTSDGKELVLYTFHLSAYSSGAGIGNAQLEMMIADMQAEYEAGNYVIGGGDFNKDLLGDSSKYWGISGGDMSWTQPFPTEVLENTGISLSAPIDYSNPVPSCRNADGPADTENQLRITVDGFLISANVTVIESRVIDTGFAYSDHNPVKLSFYLGDAPMVD